MVMYFIVVADPIQLHLLPEDQCVVSVLTEYMLDGTSAEIYDRIDEKYYLDNGVVAMIYIRKEPFRLNHVEELQSRFDSYYPDYPELFSDRFNSYITENYHL